MVKVEAVLGVWTKPDEAVHRGVVKGGSRAYALAGSEEDSDYAVLATVKVVDADRAGVICAFSYADEDYAERWIECVVDVAAQRLYVVLHYGEMVQEVPCRDFPLALNTEYKVAVTLRTMDDGTGFLTFDVNDVTQLFVEGLAAVFAAGLAGFSVEGDEGKIAEFREVQKYSVS